MNLSSFSNYFHIKNPFSISFIQIKWVLDWASISGKCRGFWRKNPETQGTGSLDGGFISNKWRGSLTKAPARRGIGWAEPSDQKRRAQIRSGFPWTGMHPEPLDPRSAVHDLKRHDPNAVRPISSQRLRSKRAKGYPYDLISTVDDQINGDHASSSSHQPSRVLRRRRAVEMNGCDPNRPPPSTIVKLNEATRCARHHGHNGCILTGIKVWMKLGHGAVRIHGGDELRRAIAAHWPSNPTRDRFLHLRRNPPMLSVRTAAAKESTAAASTAAARRVSGGGDFCSGGKGLRKPLTGPKVPATAREQLRRKLSFTALHPQCALSTLSRFGDGGPALDSYTQVGGGRTRQVRRVVARTPREAAADSAGEGEGEIRAMVTVFVAATDIARRAWSSEGRRRRPDRWAPQRQRERGST